MKSFHGPYISLDWMAGAFLVDPNPWPIFFLVRPMNSTKISRSQLKISVLRTNIFSPFSSLFIYFSSKT